MTPRPDERFDQLWQDCSPAVLRYARRRVAPGDVDDVVAETFVVAWRRLDEAPEFPLPWLLGVARHVCANVRRGGARREALHTRLAQQPVDDGRPGPDAVEDPAASAAGRALARLGERDRELLTLLAWDGLSTAEAAHALSCTQAALRVRPGAGSPPCWATSPPTTSTTPPTRRSPPLSPPG